MEYEKMDEATRYQEACKKVKQIANAIKSIKIKYYPNFTKVSDTDKQAYDQLNEQIERIAEENGLNKLKVELIEELEDKYDGNILSEDSEHGDAELQNKLLKAYYGAIDAGKQALSEGKIKRAKKCQKQADIYMDAIKKFDKKNGTNQFVEMAIHYKRERFAELVPEKVKSTTDWENLLKSCYKDEDVQERSEAKNQVEQALNEATKENIEKDTSEMILE